MALSPPAVAGQSANEPLSALPRSPGLWTPADGSVPPSAQALVSDKSVARGIVGEEMQRLTLLSERLALMSGQIEQHFTNMLHHQQRATETAQKGADATAKAFERTKVDSTTAPAAPGATPGRNTEGRSPAAPAERRAPMSYEEARAYGADMQGLKRGAAAAVNKIASRYTSDPRLTQVDGKWVDRQGTEVTQDVGERYARRMNRLGRVTGAISSVGSGEGISGGLAALGGVAARFAGPVGFAVGAGQFALSQATNQRESNRFYQQISGGSNASGFAERAREAMFSRVNMAGIMGSGEASQLFRGVSELGVSGDTRQNAVNFAVGNFKTLGTDVDTSMQMIRDSINNGVDDFTTLSKSLADVAKEARNAGVNVGEATKAFAATHAQVQQNITAGPQSSAIAAAVQSRVVALGHSAMEGVDLSGMMTQQGMQMQSAMLGQDYNSVLAQVQGGNTRLLGQGMDAAIQQLVTNSGVDVSMAQQIKQRVVGNGKKMSADDAAQIAAQMAQQGNPINVQAVMAMAQAMGIGGITPANAAQFAVTAALGGMNVADRLASTGVSGSKTNGQIGTTAGGKALVKGQDYTFDLDAAMGYSMDAYGQSALSAGGKFKGVSEAVSAYDRSVNQSGQRDPVIEALLGAKNNNGKGTMSGSTFRVQTKDGARDVSLSTAVKYYSDQLARGDVQITSGQGKGKTVAEVTGVSDPNRTVTSTGADPKGSSAEKSGTSRVNASIQVSATPELRRLLNFTTTDTATRAGVPAPAFVPPAALPSATGSSAPAATYGAGFGD